MYIQENKGALGVSDYRFVYGQHCVIYPCYPINVFFLITDKEETV